MGLWQVIERQIAVTVLLLAMAAVRWGGLFVMDRRGNSVQHDHMKTWAAVMAVMLSVSVGMDFNVFLRGEA